MAPGSAGWVGFPRALERSTRAIELARPLQLLGRTVGNTFGRIVRPGRLKDALAGTWQGHPLHPVLTDVTIGAWTTSFLLDLFGEDMQPAADALVLTGVISAAPTAVTGLSELADIVDPEERGVAAAHAIGNVGAVLLYGLSFGARKAGRRALGQALSLAGMAVATGSAFLGGHLSFRRGVGVDQTTFEDRPHDWTDAMPEEELPVGKPRLVRVDGAQVFLYRDRHRVFALANRCSHRGGPLHKGRVEDGRVTCPWHLSSFDLQDGSVRRGPATAPQPSYEVRIRSGKIQVRSRR